MGLLNVCICYAALGMMTASFAVRLRSRLLQVFGNLVLCVAMVSMIGVTISMVLPKNCKRWRDCNLFKMLQGAWPKCM